MKRATWIAHAVPFFVACAALAQGNPDRVTVPLTDPSRPALVEVDLLNGSVTVRAYQGKDVIVEARSRQRESGSEETRGAGMRRIQIGGSGLEVEEHNNRVSIEAASHAQSIDIDVQVPARTSLKIETVNNGKIVVEGVHGEIEAENVNGPITLTNVAGSVVAHALNGAMNVTFTQVDAQKPMAFSSLNGKIDVTFPPDLKANVKVKSERGDVFSDFDIVTRPQPAPTVASTRDAKGKFHVEFDRGLYGTINGGGPEIQFSNMNGAIYIRKTGAPRDQDEDSPRRKRD